MKHIFFIFIFWCSIQNGFSQETIFHTNFNNNDDITTIKGITGKKAFDLTENNPHRLALRLPILKKIDTAVTISVWVKSALESKEDYVIMSSLKQVLKNFNGWKFSVQPSGAWKFWVRQDDAFYEFTPTRLQTIRDGNWHLLTVSYAPNKGNLSFYYDGQLKGIYNVVNIKEAFISDSIMIGNSLDDPHISRIKDGALSNDSEWSTFYGQIDEIKIFNYALSPQDIADYYSKITGKKHLLLNYNNILKIMQFNIWHGANETGKETGMIRLIKLLKESNADVYTFQETYGSGEKIADALGYNFYLISTNLSIMSRYPITETFRLYQPFKSGGVQITVPGNRKINVFAVWLSHLPYYQRDLPQGKWRSIEDYMVEENDTRGKDIKNIMAGIDSICQKSPSVPVIMSGDFNSGSYLDWLKKTEKIHFGYTIKWPASITAHKSGFKDAYREVNPYPLKDIGVTWSTIKHGSNPKYQNDRIDYIYYRGKQLRVLNAHVINAGGLVRFPSDHAAISALFKWVDE